MPRLIVIAAALAALAGPAIAAPPPAKPQPAKATAKPAVAKPAAPKPGPYDARDPASLIALLAELGAKAEVAERREGDVKLTVATPAYSFGAQFVDCGKTGRACQAVAFSTASEKQRANLAQLNGFNQTSLTCRVFQDQSARPHLVYSTILTPLDSREAMRIHLGVWQGCLASFGAFLADPPGFLAAAP